MEGVLALTQKKLSPEDPQWVATEAPPLLASLKPSRIEARRPRSLPELNWQLLPNSFYATTTFSLISQNPEAFLFLLLADILAPYLKGEDGTQRFESLGSQILSKLMDSAQAAFRQWLLGKSVV